MQQQEEEPVCHESELSGRSRLSSEQLTQREGPGQEVGGASQVVLVATEHRRFKWLLIGPLAEPRPHSWSSGGVTKDHHSEDRPLKGPPT